MTPDPPPDRPVILVAGAASRDITSADPRGWRLGGAVTYGSLALARLGLRVRAVVGVDREAALAYELTLLGDAGVELHLVPLTSGPVFENLEGPDGRRQRCLAIAAPMPVAAIPMGWTQALDAILLAPVAGELDDAWASIAAHGVAAGPLVALGWQGLLRKLRADADVQRRRPASTALVSAATLVGASRDDFAPGTSAASLARLLPPGATLVLTDGEAGGLAIRRESGDRSSPARRYPAIPSDGTVDPTGAGDVFLAGMLAALLQPSLGTPSRIAAAAASLTVEAPGLSGVPDLEATRRRMTRGPRRASRRSSAVSSLTRGRPSQA